MAVSLQLKDVAQKLSPEQIARATAIATGKKPAPLQNTTNTPVDINAALKSGGLSTAPAPQRVGPVKAVVNKVTSAVSNFFKPSKTPSQTFEVGEGLTPEQKARAEAVVKGIDVKTGEHVVQTRPDPIRTPVNEALRAPIKAIASVTNPVQGYNPTSAADRFLVGDEPVTGIARKTTDMEVSGTPLSLALPAVVASTTFDLIPGLPGKNKVSKAVGEELINRFGKEAAEKIIAKGGKELAERVLKQGGEEVLAKAGLDIVAPKVGLNTKTLNIPESAKDAVVKAVADIRPELEAIKGRKLTHAEILEAAKTSEMTTKVISREETERTLAGITRARQHMAAEAEGKGLSRDFMDAVKVIHSQATDAGRTLNAFNIGADAELASIKGKLVGQIQSLGHDADKILEAGKNVDWNDLNQVTKFYREFVPPTFKEHLDEFRYINLLSSPKTHIVNAFSNVLQAGIVNPATKLASGVIDSIGSRLTGAQQKHYIAEVPAYFKGAVNAIPDALKKAVEALKGESTIGRPDVAHIPTGSKILAPGKIVTNMLEAGDVLFRNIIEAGEVEAKTLKYSKMGKKVSEAKIAAEAADDAAYYIFRKPLDGANKTGQGHLLAKIDKFTAATYKLRDAGLSWMIPFVQTPMNIFKQGIEYSPLGLATLAGSADKTEQLAKAAVGSTVFAGAGTLIANTDSTWAAPTSETDKAEFYAAGRKPYSIRVGDKWMSYSRLGPLAFPIAMAAATKEYFKDNPKAATQSNMEKATNVLAGVGGFFADQSYLEGLGNVLDMVRGDKTALARIPSSLVNQVIPLSALQRWANGLIDDVYRKTDSGLSIASVIQNARKSIIGMTKGLPAYTDPDGNPSRKSNPVLNSFSPIEVSSVDDDYEQEFQDLRNIRGLSAERADRKDGVKSEAAALYEQLKTTPKAQRRKLVEGKSKEVIAELKTMATQNDLTGFERSLQSQSQEVRAKFLYDQLKQLPSEHRKAYVSSLLEKKVITNDTINALKAYAKSKP